MRKESQLFRLKTSEQLAQQLLECSSKATTPIAPLSSDLIGISVEDLKRDHPVRYEYYLEVLKAKRNNKIPSNERICARIKVLNNLDSYIEQQKEGNGTLREIQVGVFEDLRNFLEKGNTEGYVKLPTGFGKTIIFSEFIEATGLRTLIVVPTKTLIDQTELKLGQFAGNIEVGKIFSGGKDFDKQVTITTYDSMVRKVKNGEINPLDYELLILDEAHRSLSELRMDVVKEFKDSIKIGFTATPEFSESKKLSNLLNSEIHNMGIKEAVREGILSSLSVYIAKTEVDLSSVTVSSLGDFNEKELEKAVNIQSRNMAAIQLYKLLFPDRFGVAYCVSVKHAEDLAKAFMDEGISAGFISGRQSKKEQEEVIRRFHNGQIKILCNADILIEGFDEPKISFCLNLRPTLSRVIAEQRGGRVLRLDPDNPLKHAYLIDFVDQNTKNRQIITFADIIGGTELIPRNMSFYKYKKQKLSEKVEGLSISGLKILTDTQEILRFLSEQNVDSKKNPFFSSQTLTELARFLKIKPEYLVRKLERLVSLHGSELSDLKKQLPYLKNFKKHPNMEIADSTVRFVISEEILRRIKMHPLVYFGLEQTLDYLIKNTKQCLRFSKISQRLQVLEGLNKQLKGQPILQRLELDFIDLFENQLERLLEDLNSIGFVTDHLLAKLIIPEKKKLILFLADYFKFNLDRKNYLNDLFSKEPDIIKDFFANNGSILDTELYKRLESIRRFDLEKSERVKKVVAKLFMDVDFPYNVLKCANEVVVASLSLKNVVKGLEAKVQGLINFSKSIELSMHDGKFQSNLYGTFDSLRKLFLEIELACKARVVESEGPDAKNRRKILLTPDAQNVSKIRKAIHAQLHQQHVLGEHINHLLKVEPDIVEEFMCSEDYKNCRFYKHMLTDSDRIVK